MELHIEQGPLLEASQETIGVVTGGQGLLWFDGEIIGRDSHAGTTPMPMRRDAMNALAAVALAIEDIARGHGPAGVGTLGEAHVIPRSRNPIPGAATFKAEFRNPDADALTRMEAELHERAGEIASRRGVTIAAGLLLLGALELRAQDSAGVYRLPYANGTEIRVTRDHTTHTNTITTHVYRLFYSRLISVFQCKSV